MRRLGLCSLCAALALLGSVSTAYTKGPLPPELYGEAAGSLFTMEAMSDGQNVLVARSWGDQFEWPSFLGSWSPEYNLHVADVDGDGLADLVGRNHTVDHVQVRSTIG